MNDVVIGKGQLSGKGVYANKDFKKGEVVISYSLKALTEWEYENLPETERMFTHIHWGVIYLYSEPERYVNHSFNPNTLPDPERKCDVAIRDIKKGEEITTDATKDDTVSDTINLQSLAEIIKKRAKGKERFVIALSGFGGAGKSTLARQLTNLLWQAEVVSLDDFILNRLANPSSDWSTGFDWKRLVEQVLQPLSEGKDVVTYERYDWSQNQAIASRTLKLPVYLILEGVGLLRDDLKKYFDIRVWIDVPLEVASERGKIRDREVYQVDHDALWDDLWIPADKGYADKHRPRENVDFLLDGDSVKNICVDVFKVVRDIPYRIPLLSTDPEPRNSNSL